MRRRHRLTGARLAFAAILAVLLVVALLGPVLPP